MEMLDQTVCILDNELLNDIDFSLFDMDQIKKLIECMLSTRGVTADEFKMIAKYSFSTRHMDECMSALNMNLDITYMTDKSYSLEQMRQIKLGMYHGNGNYEEFKDILNPKFNPKQMEFINKASWCSIDPKLIAHARISFPDMKGFLSLINDVRIKYSLPTVEEIFK